MPSLQRSLPLYRGLGYTARDESKGYAHDLKVNVPHPGLVFDKFIDSWLIDAAGHCEVQEPSKEKEPEKKYKTKLYFGAKRAWLEETKDLVNNNNTLKNYLDRAIVRQEKLMKSLGGECIPVKTDWRFVSGLGNGHPFETGFVWHRTLGVPYLPGSSVKGLIRAWAEDWGAAQVAEVNRLFGDIKDQGAGSLVVFDSLPVEVPTLELDIMNPHYSEYYSKELYEKPDGSRDLIPLADYLSPTPIFFLAVAAGQSFRFALAPRRPKGKGAGFTVKRGLVLLKQALATLGAGGKTVVGYGSMQVDREEEDRRRKEEKKRQMEEAKRKKKAEREAYLATLSPQRRQIEAIRSAANEPGINVMTDKKNALLQSTADLLKAAAKWSDSGDREEAARICETVYTGLGWGSAQKERERKAAIAKLRTAGGT